MVDLAREDHLRRLAGKVLEGNAELEFGVFEESVSNEEDAVPGCVRGRVLSRVSSWGMM